MTFDDFKSQGETIKQQLFSRSDIIDLDNGSMTIYSENINKYLEQYACKNATDLEDTLWYNYGVFVKIID